MFSQIKAAHKGLEFRVTLQMIGIPMKIEKPKQGMSLRVIPGLTLKVKEVGGGIPFIWQY